MRTLSEEDTLSLLDKIVDESITDIVDFSDLVDTNDRHLIDKAVYHGTLIAKEAVAYNQKLNEEDCRHLIRYIPRRAMVRDILIRREVFPSEVLKQLAATEHDLLTLLNIRNHKNCDQETRVILALRGVSSQTKYYPGIAIA